MNDFYQILDTAIQTHLVASSINQELAAKITSKIINDLSDCVGGRVVYLKNNYAVKLAEKHKRIVAEYNGQNQIEICRKYGITEIWLKKLLARAKKDEHAQ